MKPCSAFRWLWLTSWVGSWSQLAATGCLGAELALKGRYWIAPADRGRYSQPGLTNQSGMLSRRSPVLRHPPGGAAVLQTRRALSNPFQSVFPTSRNQEANTAPAARVRFLAADSIDSGSALPRTRCHTLGSLATARCCFLCLALELAKLPQAREEARLAWLRNQMLGRELEAWIVGWRCLRHVKAPHPGCSQALVRTTKGGLHTLRLSGTRHRHAGVGTHTVVQRSLHGLFTTDTRERARSEGRPMFVP